MKRRRARSQKVGVDDLKYGQAKSVGGEDQSCCLCPCAPSSDASDWGKLR